MELLKGFSFDIQRFADLSVAAAKAVSTTEAVFYDSDTSTWVATAGITDGMKLVAKYDETATANQLIVKNSTQIVGASGTLVKVGNGFPDSATAATAPTITDSAGNVIIVTGKELYIPSGETVTLGDAAGTISAISGTTLFPVTGDIVLAATVSVDVDLNTHKGETAGTITYTKGTQVGSTVTTSEGAIAIAETSTASDKTDTKVTNAGVLTGLDTNGTATYSNTAGAALTVKASADNSGATFVAASGVTALTGSGTVTSDGAGVATLAAGFVATAAAAQLTFADDAVTSVNKGTFTSFTAGTKIDTSVAGAGNVTVGEITFEGNGTAAGDDAVGTITSETSVTIEKNGVVSFSKNVTDEVTVNTTNKFTNGSSTSSLEVAKLGDLVGIHGASVAKVNSATTVNAIYTSGGTLTAGDKVAITKTATNGVTVTGNATNGKTSVTGLDAVGDKVYITDHTDDSVTIIEITKVVGTAVRARVSLDNGTTWASYDGTTSTIWSESGGTGTVIVPSVALQTDQYTTGGTLYFNADGQETTEKAGDAVAKLTTGTNRALEVSGTVTKNINVSNDTIAVTDKGTTNAYTVAAGKIIEAKNASFTVNADGDLTKASGTIKVTAGTLGIANSNAAGSGVTIDLNVAGTSVSYAAGTNLSKTTVNTDAGKYVITETQNKDTAAATVITKAGAITGLDTGATVTGFAKSAAATITTAGSGKFTVNDVAWTVSESDNGVTLGYDNSGVLTSVNLGKGEIVETTAKLTGKTVTVNQEAGTKVADFAFTKAQAGATFSYDGTNATAAVFTKGDVVVVGANTYTVNAVGSGKDGVIVTSAGALKGLNDGDKVTVAVTATPTADNTVYEVSGKAMIVTKTAGGTTTTAAYTLTDEAEPFGATNAVAPTLTTDITNATAGTTVAANINQVNATKPVAVTSIVDGVYVNADGTLTFSKDKAVGKITETDSLIKYDSQSSKAQEVNVTGAGSKDWYITTGDGKDQVTFADNTNVSINGGAGDDTIKASGNGDKILYVSSGKNDVSLGAGSGSAQVSLGSGNDKFSATGYTGDVVITAAGGNNNIDASGISGDVTIIGSSGNDTIKAAKADNIVKGNGGNNTFDISASSVKIADYAFGKDVIATSATGVAPTVAKADLSSDGKITSGTQTADISATAGSFYAATLVDSTGKKTTNVAWAKDGAAKIDTSSFSKDANLFGNEDGANYLVSGAGKDVIHSYGDNDTVYGGASDDSYILTTGKTGRVVGFSTNGGKDTASGFNAKFEEGDSIYMLDGSFANLKATYDGTAATLKSGSAQLVFTGSGVGTQSSGAGEFVINGKKAAVLAAGATATVGSASYADAYIGDNSAVDFSSVDSDLYVDLSNDLASSGSGAKFVGIHTVVGGAGKSTLIGSAKDDLITAGTGGTSLYGGKGKDTLVGNGDYSDMFFIGGGSGMSTITSFQTSEYDNADTVKVLGNVTAAKLTNDGIEISSDSSKGIITNLVNGSVDANAKVRIESNNFTGVAKVGSASSNNSFTFEKGVGYYGGGSGEDKLAVDSSNTENAQVWLDGSQGVAYTSVDVVDFSSGSADYILAGDSAKNTISGGNGNNSLWGGVGNSVDILESSSNGTTTFFYGFGEGNDTISSNGANDAVNLYNIKLSDVKTGEITGTGVNVEFNDGSKLAVNTTRNVKFSLASGESYIANQSTKGWDQA